MTHSLRARNDTWCCACHEPTATMFSITGQQQCTEPKCPLPASHVQAAAGHPSKAAASTAPHPGGGALERTCLHYFQIEPQTSGTCKGLPAGRTQIHLATKEA